MKEKLLAAMPEIALVQSAQLRTSIVTCYLETLQAGGWQVQDLDEIPFTLLIPNCHVSYREHVRAVTVMCSQVFERFNSFYQDKHGYKLDYDRLITGALLHDIGKLIEYERKDGKVVKSLMGKNLRHPFSGTAIALKNGVPSEIAHIIANHAKEGDGTLRSPEAVVVNKIDMLNFEAIKSHEGMI